MWTGGSHGRPSAPTVIMAHSCGNILHDAPPLCTQSRRLNIRYRPAADEAAAAAADGSGGKGGKKKGGGKAKVGGWCCAVAVWHAKQPVTAGPEVSDLHVHDNLCLLSCSGALAGCNSPHGEPSGLPPLALPAGAYAVCAHAECHGVRCATHDCGHSGEQPAGGPGRGRARNGSNMQAPQLLAPALVGRCQSLLALAHMLALPNPQPCPPPHCLQADGSVVIPEALRPFMMGIDVIRPKKKVEA